MLLIGFSCSANLLAQEKFEKESRIKQRDVPLKASSFMDSLKLNTKIKWYKEDWCFTRTPVITDIAGENIIR